jgi:hypothetical protein
MRRKTKSRKTRRRAVHSSKGFLGEIACYSKTRPQSHVIMSAPPQPKIRQVSTLPGNHHRPRKDFNRTALPAMLSMIRSKPLRLRTGPYQHNPLLLLSPFFDKRPSRCATLQRTKVELARIWCCDYWGTFCLSFNGFPR